MAAKKRFTLGTRSSPLAMWQADRVTALLKKVHPETSVEIIQIQTSGDKILDKPLVQVGGKGIFTKEIEQAMLDGEIDFAVHSMKDLPTELPAGLELSCIPERSSPLDALFSKTAKSIREMPDDPAIATGSLRRRAQILHLKPNADIIDIRGNVNTRRQKFEESNWDGFIMAHAALVRMGWEEQAVRISPLELLPAPAQGALAVESRIDDEETSAFLQSIHNQAIAPPVMAERTFLAALEGGCQVPLGAYASRYGNALVLTGMISSLDGKRLIRKTAYGNTHAPQQLGEQLARAILDEGGLSIKEELMQANSL